MATATFTAAELLSYGIDVTIDDLNIGESFSTLTRGYTLISKNALVDYTFSYVEFPETVPLVKVQEEETLTSGHVKIQAWNFTIPAGNTGDVTRCLVTMKRNVNIYNINLMGYPENLGDTLSSWVGPPTPVGTITQDINIGDTYGYVSVVPLAVYKPGWTLAVKNGADPIQPISDVESIDTPNARFKLDDPSPFFMPSGSPVYVWLPRLVNIPLNGGILKYGGGKIGGSYVNKGYVVTFFYTNNGSEQKRFSVVAELTY